MAAAARSLLRSSLLRSAAPRPVPATGPRPVPRHLPNLRPAAPRVPRSPLELSSCVDSLMPMHTATSSAVMTLMLSIFHSYGSLPEVGLLPFKTPPELRTRDVASETIK